LRCAEVADIGGLRLWTGRVIADGLVEPTGVATTVPPVAQAAIVVARVSTPRQVLTRALILRAGMFFRSRG